jgi:hypothetical protein
MYSHSNQKLLVVLLIIITISSCQKKELSEPPATLNARMVATETHGHLKQTKTFTADVVKKWLAVQLPLLYSPPVSYGVNPGRYMAYSGVALYEAVVPGMPAYQSLYGQLNEMPEMPKTEPGKAYHWPTSANAALAEITR